MSEAEYRRRLAQVGADLHRATTEWTDRRRRRKRSIAAACSAVATVGVALVVGANLGSRGTESAAAQVLKRAAAADPGRAKASRSKYLYTATLVSQKRIIGSPGSEQLVTTTRLRELWAGGDGSGRQVTQSERSRIPANLPAAPAPGQSPSTSPTTPPPSDRPEVGQPGVNKGKPRRLGAEVKRYRKGTITAGELGSSNTKFRDRILEQFGLSARELVELSADQGRFNRVARAKAREVVGRLDPSGQPTEAAVDGQAFFLIASLLGQWGERMPPPLRAALYRLASTLEGISLDESFTDDQGRRGIALSLGDASIVLDPASYDLRATKYRLGDTEITIETVQTAVVDRPTARPR